MVTTKKNARVRVVAGRISERERTLLRLMARNEQQTVSDAIRVAILEAAARRGLVADDEAENAGDGGVA